MAELRPKSGCNDVRDHGSKDRQSAARLTKVLPTSRSQRHGSLDNQAHSRAEGRR
jgi:hypothetical protein